VTVDDERERFVAWADELRRVHARLRVALEAARRGATQEDARGAPATRELLLHCHAFCGALDSHHGAEDHVLFPAIAAEQPALSPVLGALEADHLLIAGLTEALMAEPDRSPVRYAEHLDGIAAIMESHFRFEERRLLAVLDRLALAGPVERVLGVD
jgi:hypothetical protein